MKWNMLFKPWMLAWCLGGLACVAHAAGGDAASGVDSVVRKAVESLAPGIVIDSIEPALVPGFHQVIAAGQLVFVSDDGKYIMDGNLVDVAAQKSLTDTGWAAFRKTQIAKIPESDRIVFAPVHPRYRVVVFTDVTCPYCMELHKHVVDFNKAGIALEYVAWPRDGVTMPNGHNTATYDEMVSVWCAADRKAAFTAAKQGKKPKAATCTNPVKNEFDLGLRMGITGTPAIFAEDGTMLGGYVTPDDLLKALDKKSGKAGG